jgi:hypothetical protein
MKRLEKWLGISLALLIMIGSSGCVSPKAPGEAPVETRVKVRENVTIEPEEAVSRVEMERLAGERAMEYWSANLGIDWEYPIELGILDEPLIKGLITRHEVYGVEGLFQHPAAAIAVAVGYDKHAFVLPDEFNDMIQREGISVGTGDRALDLAKVYVMLQDHGYLTEGSAFLIFPESAADIPESGGEGGAVRPPHVSKKNGGYNVVVYSWSRLGGVLDKWEFDIKEDGRIQAEKTKVVEDLGASLPIM